MATLTHNPNSDKPLPEYADMDVDAFIAMMAAGMEKPSPSQSNRTVKIFAGVAKEKSDDSREMFVVGAELPADPALNNFLWFLGGCALGYCAVRALAK